MSLLLEEGLILKLKRYMLKLKKCWISFRAVGYLLDTDRVLYDVGEEERENPLYYHSEKLATTFGLLKMKPGEIIRITKNLRICKDCHQAGKLISKVYYREIVVRDRNRFHHFRGGKCSCKNYW
ncbi:Pentatricopeptide repeat-containing protein [Abeliophyllum distichum]|uniref:Pentatricopeptide repeat-containing protein n=1 Tax=Abeliophyllum distichum TaxID=126358 RepID=A0ABD1RRR5_9LAMI